MIEHATFFFRRSGMIAAMAWITFHTAVAYAKPEESPAAGTIGRVEFDEASLPPANVELDLSQGMLANLFDISDGAIAGAVETLNTTSKGDQPEAIRLAASQLEAMRQIVGLTGDMVQEVRVRAYEEGAGDLSPRFYERLKEGKWEKVVVVRQGDERACGYVIYENDAIRGVFVMAGGNDGQVLVNVVCNVSPEKAKQLTSAATKIGLDNNLQQLLEMKLRQSRGGTPQSFSPVPQPPAPPKPPKE